MKNETMIARRRYEYALYRYGRRREPMVIVMPSYLTHNRPIKHPMRLNRQARERLNGRKRTADN